MPQPTAEQRIERAMRLVLIFIAGCALLVVASLGFIAGYLLKFW